MWDVRCAMCDVRCAMCDVRCAMCVDCCEFCVVLCRAPCAVRRAPCAVRRAPCAVRRAPCAVRRAPCAVRRAPCAVRRAPCAVCREISRGLAFYFWQTCSIKDYLNFSGKHPATMQLMREGCSYTVYSQLLVHTSVFPGALYSETTCPRFNTAAHDSNPGSISRESDALPLSHCATSLNQRHTMCRYTKNV